MSKILCVSVNTREYIFPLDDCHGGSNTAGTTPHISATLKKTSFVTGMDGSDGGAIYFSGSKYSYAELKNTGSALDTGINLSILMHVRPVALGKTQCLLRYMSKTGGVALYITKSNLIEFHLLERGKTRVSKIRAAAGALELGKWSYIAVVYSDAFGKATVYVNKTQEKEVLLTVKPLGTAGNVRLGGYKNDVYNGDMACLQISHNAFTQSEVESKANCNLRECLHLLIFYFLLP